MHAPMPSPFALVGRDRELAVLRERLAAARAGTGTLVLIGGEAGIGKTALVETLCREGEVQGILVLTGRCYDLTETPPYGPWIELFGRYRHDMGAHALSPAFSWHGTGGDIANRDALFQQVLDFFAAFTHMPLILLLDDMHWADPISLDLLRVLGRALPALPILTLVTYRYDELSPACPLTPLLPSLVREGHTIRLDVSRLAEESIRHLVARRYDLSDADRDRLVTHLWERAEGNPFFTLELLHTLEEGQMLYPVDGQWRVRDLNLARVPPLVQQVIEGRLRRLEGAHRRYLAIAAIIGQEVPLSLWNAIAGGDDEALIPVVERAIAAHLMVETPDGAGLRFVHALIRETLYEATPLPLRRKWHQQLGDILSALPRPDPDAVANHFQRAGDAHAAEWLVRAGEHARRSDAVITAAERYTAALALVESWGDDYAQERGWLRYLIAVMQRHMDPERGIVSLSEAIALAEACSDAELAARARSIRGMLAAFAGDCGQAMEDKDAELAAPGYRLPQPTVVLSRLGMNHPFPVVSGSVEFPLMFAGRLHQALAVANTCLAQGEQSTLHCIGTVSALLGRPDEARAAYARLQPFLRRSSFAYTTAVAMAEELHLLQLPYAADHVADRRRLAAELDAAWARVSGPYGVDASFIRLPFLLVEGEWVEATHLMHRFLAAPARVHYFNVEGAAGVLAHACGETDIARQLVQRRLPDGPKTEPGTTWFIAATAMQRLAAMLASESGDLPAARAWLEAHDRWLSWSESVLGRVEGQVCWATYYRAADDPVQAYSHATSALTEATAPRQPLGLLTAHRLLGELETEAGHFDSAARHLGESLALADACAAPYERALTMVALAALHATTEQRDGARSLLNDIRSIGESLHAPPLLARVDALAARIEAITEPIPTYPAGLSPREVTVLRLVAAGQTNEEIALALFISRRTVNRHIENLYRKIDAHNKADATAYALRHHLA